MPNRQILGLSMGLAIALSAGSAFADGHADVANGQTIAERRCGSCHTFDEGGRNKVGPNLYGIIGRMAGQTEDFRYSDLNAGAADVGLVWTEELVAQYLPDPQGFLETYVSENGGTPSGRTRMSFRLRDEQDTKDVAAYLATLGAQ